MTRGWLNEVMPWQACTCAHGRTPQVLMCINWYGIPRKLEYGLSLANAVLTLYFTIEVAIKLIGIGPRRCGFAPPASRVEVLGSVCWPRSVFICTCGALPSACWAMDGGVQVGSARAAGTLSQPTCARSVRRSFFRDGMNTFDLVVVIASIMEVRRWKEGQREVTGTTPGYARSAWPAYPHGPPPCTPSVPSGHLRPGAQRHGRGSAVRAARATLPAAHAPGVALVRPESEPGRTPATSPAHLAACLRAAGCLLSVRSVGRLSFSFASAQGGAAARDRDAVPVRNERGLDEVRRVWPWWASWASVHHRLAAAQERPSTTGWAAVEPCRAHPCSSPPPSHPSAAC
jgi:hypothetical protein